MPRRKAKPLSERRFIALDIESTGMDPRSARIMELYIVQVTYPRLRRLRSWHALVRPDVDIPVEATMLNGLTIERLSAALPFKDIAKRIQAIVNDSVIIAYNGRRFDVPLLHHELVRNGCQGIPSDQLVIDPYEFFLEDYPRTLTGAAKWYLGRERFPAHNAATDTDVMLDVFGRQLANRDPTRLLHTLADETSVDYTKYFVTDKDGVIRFGAGRHRGEPAKDHFDYLLWILRSPYHANIREAVGRVLDECSALKFGRAPAAA